MLPSHCKDTDYSLVLQDQTCQHLTLAEIQSATHNFGEKLVIGHGGFGKVYKCSIMIGSVLSEVAIKRLDSTSDQGVTQYEAKVKLISKLRHGNLVSLIGYCTEEKAMVLVYEFMPNGTIRDHLRKADCALSWLQRLEICIGAARALDYLHTGPATKLGVIHRDVKTSNILLDANFAAKVSDFGLAKVGHINQTRSYVSTEVRGSYGYMDPCYISSNKLTRKSDVYAFGVVLFEVLSGKQAVFSTVHEDHWTLASWAQDQMKKGKLNQLIDSRLKGQMLRKCLKEYASIAGLCLHNQLNQRPTMAEVVVKLDSILSQERESVDSVFDEGTFIYKLMSFFTAKADLIPAPSRQSLKIFTYADLARATNGFKHQEHSSTLPINIYKGWVDEMTYAPTECGVGFAIYVRVKHIEIPQLNALDLKPEEFNHPNLVKLLGYCLDAGKLYCVYKFTADTGLDRLRFNGSIWRITNSRPPLYCWTRNLMEKSFLLDDSYSFHTDAFYAAPEWFSYQLQKLELCRPGVWRHRLFIEHIDPPTVEKLSYVCSNRRTSAYIFNSTLAGSGAQSEVYAFGVVLLEILTGMKVFDVSRPQEEVNLSMIVDPELQQNNIFPNGAFRVVSAYYKLSSSIRRRTPINAEVLKVLHKLYQEESQSV